MHDRLILLAVGVPLFLAVCTFCAVACLRAFAAENAREDAHYARLRGHGMGDPATVPQPPTFAPFEREGKP